MKHFIKSLTIICLTVISANVSYAQKASISGTVKDAKSGEELIGATVMLLGTSIGASVDFNGDFRIANITPGTYDLVISFVSYQSDTLRGLTLTAGQELKLDRTLSQQSLQLEGVSIVATRTTNTEAAVLMEVKNSKLVMNAISSEQIEKSQDSDASEVVRRVPGVTIIGNSYIMIRGLSERYNTVLLHDVFAPSMEADVKSFAFDILPSNLIDRMLIYKSPAAELPGEFAGGVVKVYTKSIPDERSTSVSLGTTYREGSSLRNFKQPKRGAGHQFGFNDGYNDLPSGFPVDLRRVTDVSDNGALDQWGRSLENNWIPEEVNSGMDRTFSFSNAAKFKLFGKDAGNITALSYSNSRTVFDVERADYNAYDNINDRSDPIFRFDDQLFTQNVRTGLLSNFAIRIDPANIIEFKNLFTVFNSAEYVDRGGYHIEFGYAPDNHSFDQVYRGIYSGQLTGRHSFNEFKTRFNWALGYGYSYRDQPDYRRYRADRDTVTGESTLFVGVPISPNYLGRFFSEMREHNQTVNLSLEHDLGKEGKWSPTVRTGVFFENKNRSFNARNIGYVRSNVIQFDESLLNVSIDSLFHPTNINQGPGIRIGEQSNPSDSYTASNMLIAYYAGADLPFLKKFVLNTGVRLEYNMQRLESASLTGQPIIVDNPILSVLPSANLSYNVTQKQVIRLSYGQTVNRPEFRELAPFGFYDFNYNLVKKGSDSLRTPTIHNLDLKWEWYPNPTELISVSVFYKRFNDAIETLFVPGGGSGGIKTFTYGNAAYATSYGVELEVRKSLEGLTGSKFMNRFSILLNGALIHSEVNLGLAQLGQSNQRPMYGQSPYIANAGIYYQDRDHGVQVSLMYNIIGPRIFIIGFDAYPDIYEMPRHLLDFTANVRLYKGLDLKFGIGDIVNQPFTLLQDANEDGKFSRKDDQIIQNFSPGRTWSLGLSYRF
jgi:outer membrane receptor for ferrienterochelin and colicin